MRVALYWAVFAELQHPLVAVENELRKGYSGVHVIAGRLLYAAASSLLLVRRKKSTLS